MSDRKAHEQRTITPGPWEYQLRDYGRGPADAAYAIVGPDNRHIGIIETEADARAIASLPRLMEKIRAHLPALLDDEQFTALVATLDEIDGKN